MEIAGDRDAAFFVGGVNETVEALGGVGADGQQADVVNDDKVGTQDPGDGPGVFAAFTVLGLFSSLVPTFLRGSSACTTWRSSGARLS